MSENSANAYTVLHLRFKLRVPPGVMLAHSREAATVIASVEGLIWKIWVLQEEGFETRHARSKDNQLFARSLVLYSWRIVTPR